MFECDGLYVKFSDMVNKLSIYEQIIGLARAASVESDH